MQDDRPTSSSTPTPGGANARFGSWVVPSSSLLLHACGAMFRQYPETARDFAQRLDRALGSPLEKDQDLGELRRLGELVEAVQWPAETDPLKDMLRGLAWASFLLDL